MKNLFKPEDFDKDGDGLVGTEVASRLANEKLNSLMESWPVVYNEERATAWTCFSSPEDTHQARLAFIEPITREYIYIDSGVDFNGERLYRKVENEQS